MSASTSLLRASVAAVLPPPHRTIRTARKQMTTLCCGRAIIAVYGMLLRQQAPRTVTGNAEYGDFRSRSAAEETAMRCTSSDTSPASGGSASPLLFIAYASRQRSPLNLIAVLLVADRVDDASCRWRPKRLMHVVSCSPSAASCGLCCLHRRCCRPCC